MPLADSTTDAPSASDQIAIHLTSNNSHRGLLCVNHEYTLPHLMFSGYANSKDGKRNTLPQHIAIEQEALGHSVVEIELNQQGGKLSQTVVITDVLPPRPPWPSWDRRQVTHA